MDRQSDRESSAAKVARMEFRRRAAVAAWREVVYVLANCVVPQAAVLTCVAFSLGPTFGVVATFGIPMLGGFVAAAKSRRSDPVGCGAAVLGVFGLAALSTLFLGAAGPFCLTTAAVVFFPFIPIGAYGGAAFRRHLDRRRMTRRFLVLLPLALLPLHWTEAALRGEDPRVVHRTEHFFPSPPSELWEALRTYDEVDHQPPPLALRIGFPRPISTHGDLLAIGDAQRCTYTKGSRKNKFPFWPQNWARFGRGGSVETGGVLVSTLRISAVSPRPKMARSCEARMGTYSCADPKGFIVKQLTALEPGRRYAFDVVEQQVGFERSVRLRRGSFTLEPRPEGGTRLIVETVYDDRLRPAWIWRPFESWAISSLHRYLIEGVERSRRDLPVPVRFAELAERPRSEPPSDR